MSAPTQEQPPQVTPTQQQPPRASLLGMPVEIRRAIYDVLKNFDFQHPIDRMKRHQDPPGALPLSGLARSCKFLALEIRSHQDSLPDSERYATIRIDNSMTTMFLTHAPCPSADLKAVKIVFDLRITNGFYFGSPELGWLTHIGFFRKFLTGFLDVQVFFHAEQDAEDPPQNSQVYEDEIRRIREKLERYLNLPPQEECPACIVGRVVRLMEFSYEPWKCVSSDTHTDGAPNLGTQQAEQDNEGGTG
jgi:hypothetical protein